MQPGQRVKFIAHNKNGGRIIVGIVNSVADSNLVITETVIKDGVPTPHKITVYKPWPEGLK